MKFRKLSLRAMILLLLALMALFLAAIAYAATTLSAKVEVKVNTRFVESLDLSSPVDNLALDLAQSFTNGTGDKKANLIFHDTRTLADGATENLDLAGTLTDAFGTSLTFVKVKAIIVKNTSTTQTISVGGAASAQFVNWVADATDIIKIPPEGVFVLTAPNAGFTVTATTADLLKVANSAGAAADYRICIIGSTS